MYIWDHGNIAHLAVHGVLPAEAEEVIGNTPLEIEQQLRKGERRLLYVGSTLAERVLCVVVTHRQQQLRVITAFPANRKLRERWLRSKEDDHA